jgi:hemerythrin-like metal-binding protein
MIAWDTARHGLDVSAMDTTHREFLDLAARLARADDAAFPALFKELLEHTRLHFAQEGRLMRACAFPATGEHEGEHARVLGELLRFRRAVARGRIALARAYVRQGLPEWFSLHLATMDSALAAYYRARPASASNSAA